MKSAIATKNDVRAVHPGSKTKVGRLSRAASQTLLRWLDVLEAVAAGTNSLGQLAVSLNLNRSTTHRLASALVERRYLSFVSRAGYGLGPEALEIGYQARMQVNISRVAHGHFERLAVKTAREPAHSISRDRGWKSDAANQVMKNRQLAEDGPRGGRAWRLSL